MPNYEPIITSCIQEMQAMALIVSIYYTPIHYGLSIISQLLLYLQLILVAVNITSHILPHFTIRI